MMQNSTKEPHYPAEHHHTEKLSEVSNDDQSTSLKEKHEEQKHARVKEEKTQHHNRDVHSKHIHQEQQQKIQELTLLLQRLQADFDNFRKRSEKTTQESVQRGTIDVITQLLSILDSFELALKNCAEQDEVYKGFQLIYLQLYDLLRGFGLKAIDAVHVPFDPYQHEALQRVVNNAVAENTVVEIFQKGYMLNGYVLRYAKVKVNVHEYQTTTDEAITR